jgi:hypothetical protein
MSDLDDDREDDIMAAFGLVRKAATQPPPNADEELLQVIGSVNGGHDYVSGRDGVPAGATDHQISTIPFINQAYRTNPTAAVIANIPPYERPEDIELWNADGRIERMVQWYDEADQRAEALHKNPRYEFGRLVKEYVLDHRRPTDNNIVDVNDPLMNIRVVVPPSAGLTAAGPPQQVNLNRPPGEAGGPAFALGPQPATAQEEQRRQQDFYYGRQVSDALQTIGVSGRFQLDHAVVLGSNMALGSLSSHNGRKFGRKKLDDFLGDDAVMTLMVRLTGTHITQMNIINPKRYYHDEDSDRRKKEVAAIVIEMDQKLKYEQGRFTIASDDEAADQLAQLAKRIRAAKSGRRYYH